MKLSHFVASAALALVFAQGCASTGTAMRGQSPAGYQPPVAAAPRQQPAGSQIQQTHLTTDHQPMREAMADVSDHVHESLDGQHTTHGYEAYSGDGTPIASGHGLNCPIGGCPQGGCPQGHCQQGGCPGGACGGGTQYDWYPKHGYSHSYSEPKDLSYPAPNVPGGAVIYPYYTHKGPSDFFTK